MIHTSSSPVLRFPIAAATASHANLEMTVMHADSSTRCLPSTGSSQGPLVDAWEGDFHNSVSHRSGSAAHRHLHSAGDTPRRESLEALIKFGARKRASNPNIARRRTTYRGGMTWIFDCGAVYLKEQSICSGQRYTRCDTAVIHGQGRLLTASKQERTSQPYWIRNAEERPTNPVRPYASEKAERRQTVTSKKFLLRTFVGCSITLSDPQGGSSPLLPP